MKTTLDRLFLTVAITGVAVSTFRLALPLFTAATPPPAAPQATQQAAPAPVILDALDNDPSRLEALLKSGADVNAAGMFGLTPLMRAATMSEATVRLLLSHGANVKARSAVGNDALVLAARKHGNAAIVKCLLESGAEPNGRTASGATPLMAAIAAEDVTSVKLLLEAGAEVNAQPNPDKMGFLFGGGRTPLMWAAWRRNVPLVRMLLERGAGVKEITGLGSALHQAAWARDTETARTLLEAGADPNQRDPQWNFTPLHWAAASEHSDPSLVALLLERGADVNAEGGQNVDNYLGVAQTPLMLALQRGPTPIVAALRAAGANEPTASAAVRPDKKPAGLPPDLTAVIRAAAQPLQHTATESKQRFLAHASAQNCASCHQQHVPLMALSAAQKFQADVQPEAVKSVLDGLVEFDTNPFNAQPVFQPEPAVEFGYSTMGFAAQGLPRSSVTDAMVHSLLIYQGHDGRWHYNLPRPPMESSDVTATALAIRTLTLYPDPRRTAEISTAVARCSQWLQSCMAETTEEKAYRLLGLTWAKASEIPLNLATANLLRDQRDDGGWGQLEHLPPDAYGTGLTLYALLTAGTVERTDSTVSRSVAFLRSTQQSDGTWLVRRRAIPFQPPMQSEFPHGADSWISSAGTSWAVMALALVNEGNAAAAPKANASTTTAPASEAPATQSASSQVDFHRDLKPILERSCTGCHSGTKPKGGYDVTTPESLATAGSRGTPAIHPGDPDHSPLLRAISDEEPDFEMPPLAQRHKYPALSSEEKQLFTNWICQSASSHVASVGNKD